MDRETKKILEEVMEYLKDDAVAIDGEWGECRGWDKCYKEEPNEAVIQYKKLETYILSHPESESKDLEIMRAFREQCPVGDLVILSKEEYLRLRKYYMDSEERVEGEECLLCGRKTLNNYNIGFKMKKVCNGCVLSLACQEMQYQLSKLSPQTTEGESK
jgi:hypothetical protein